MTGRIGGAGGVTAEHPVLVVNTASRTGAKAFETARDTLTGLGFAPVHAYGLNDPSRVPATVDRALRDGCDLLVLGGGDGTVSAVVDQLVETPTTLAVLPLGTANDFARTLEIPRDVEAACTVLESGKVVDVDLGLADDDYFVNVASLGLSVAVTHALTSDLKRRLGTFAYPVATLRAYRGYEPFQARLEFPLGDHEPVQIEHALQVAIGNGRYYGGGNVVSPHAGIDDHTLDVYAIARGRFREHMAVAAAFRNGRFVEHPLVTHVGTREVVVRTNPPRHVNIDGEVVSTTPERFRVHRNGLHVVVPAGSQAASLDTPAP